jgi:hypothetical protein
MKDEDMAILVEGFNERYHFFILPPSSFILAFNGR